VRQRVGVGEQPVDRGELTYSPAVGETGEVSVDYRVCNTAVVPSVCSDATLSVDIIPDTDGDGVPDSSDPDDDNDGVPGDLDPHPREALAVDDSVSTRQGVPVTVDVLANDDFLAGATVSLTNRGTGSGRAAVELDALSGELTYTPAADDVGPVSVGYRVCNIAVSPEVCGDATLVVDVLAQEVPGDVDDSPGDSGSAPGAGDPDGVSDDSTDRPVGSSSPDAQPAEGGVSPTSLAFTGAPSAAALVLVSIALMLAGLAAERRGPRVERRRSPGGDSTP